MRPLGNVCLRDQPRTSWSLQRAGTMCIRSTGYSRCTRKRWETGCCGSFIWVGKAFAFATALEAHAYPYVPAVNPLSLPMSSARC